MAIIHLWKCFVKLPSRVHLFDLNHTQGHMHGLNGVHCINITVSLSHM